MKCLFSLYFSLIHFHSPLSRSLSKKKRKSLLKGGLCEFYLKSQIKPTIINQKPCGTLCGTLYFSIYDYTPDKIEKNDQIKILLPITPFGPEHMGKKVHSSANGDIII